MGIELSGNRRDSGEKIRRIERALLEIQLHDQHAMWEARAELKAAMSEVMLS